MTESALNPETLPQGVRLCVQVFLISDSAGLESCVEMSGIRKLPELTDAFVDGIALRMPGEAEWRIMTDEEITAYLKREAEDTESLTEGELDGEG